MNTVLWIELLTAVHTGLKPSNNLDLLIKGNIKMNRRKELKMEYKMAVKPIGIYKIHNLENGKIYLGKSMNLDGAINSSGFQLKLNAHKNKSLQDEWNKLGADKFSFEILEVIEQSDEVGRNYKDELDNLQEIWVNKLQPYGEKEYK